MRGIYHPIQINEANVQWYNEASPRVDVNLPTTLPSDVKPTEESPHTYRIKLTAHGDNGDVIAETDSQLGYALDNIAPPKVQNLFAAYAENHIHFSLAQSPAHDLREYRLFEMGENDHPGAEPVLVTTQTEGKIAAPQEAGEYWYVAKAVDVHGNVGEFSNPVEVVVPTGTGEITELPKEYDLKQNYPNPFNPITQISYSIPEFGHVRLEVYNALGQRVATLVDAHRSPGIYQESFDARHLASGLYIYRLHAESYTKSKQMLLVK